MFKENTLRKIFIGICVGISVMSAYHSSKRWNQFVIRIALLTITYSLRDE